MRLIVVANRLSLVIKKEQDKFVYKQSSGGLATGLKCVKNDMDFIWIGNVTGIKEEDRKEVEETCWSNYKAVPVFVDKQLNQDSYNLYCNNILWPLLHSFDNLINNESKFQAYKEYNKLFCDRILEVAEENDVIWVHDYHLMLLPKMIKERKNVKVAFFLHTPFPSGEVFCNLPNSKDILKGLLLADKIGFHLPEYKSQFIDACKTCLSINDFIKNKEGNQSLPTNAAKETNQKNNSNKPMKQVNKSTNEVKEKSDDSLKVTKLCDSNFYNTVKGIRYSPSCIETFKKVSLSSIPIGIDPNMFREVLKKDKVQKRINELKNIFKNKKVILGVDRTDYIKGMPHRMKCYEKYLSKYKNNSTVYIQIAVPSRMDLFEYNKLVTDIKLYSTGINNDTGINNNKVLLYNKSVDFDELCALYSLADALLITSLRDGMNLVALEYIACQENKKGVLILSKFAGAVDTLPGCITVNPWSFEEVADKINGALSMNENEKSRRYSINKINIDKFTAVNWAKKNLEVLFK
ncbi:alpha,alpha-trehalose-phosphate synthase (UDP-forming) [Anncaliia algerae PRA339]|uniref:Alpha,alpha-trehalose-phosphate synthase (UDP-forming) n=2 Tax=Anncaliia algerae PRA339 TaxID=1288291 RepID=A0A059F4C5_9MICR|nr:alpha,alpha-trehalose-phosphate synthase (UDP-forming) [Anncaliia algerae PRA339]